jgi:hypothetical protein
VEDKESSRCAREKKNMAWTDNSTGKMVKIKFKFKPQPLRFLRLFMRRQ